MLQEIQEKVNQKSSSEAVVNIEQRLLYATGLPQISDKLDLVTPSPRAGHSLTLVSSRTLDKNLHVEEGNRNSKNIMDSSTEKEDDIFVLFGGANHEQGFLDDLFLLKQIQPELKWHQIKLFSSPSGPAARYEHAALSIRRKSGDSSITRNELMIMFGAGIDGPLSDCWVYNIGKSARSAYLFHGLDESKWTELETKGSKPCPRVLKSVAYIESLNRVYLFGGGQQNNVPISDSNTYCLDIGNIEVTVNYLDSLRWFMVSGDRSLHPSKRLGHSLTVIGKKIYLFGGLCNNDIMNDLWVFDTGFKY